MCCAVSLFTSMLNAVNAIFCMYIYNGYFEAVTFEFKFEANKRLNKFCKRYILPEFMILFVIDECVDPMKRRKTSSLSYKL